MANRSQRLYKRQWLNSKRGTAFVEASVYRHKETTYIDASLKIADCNEQIQLDFDVSHGVHRGNSSLKERLKKIHMLQGMLIELERVLIEQSIEAEKVAEEAKKKPKNRPIKLSELLAEVSDED